MGDIADLTAKTYEIARLIPHGRVTTYGHIARLAGYPNYSRHVGNALKMLPPDSTVPWQRVISSKGIISPRGDQGLGVARQRDRLEQEGVVVTTLAGAGGEKVDIRAYGWFPENVELDG
ncbi:6-O-methylguanine DNA methyltransferase [Papiliotrema laurentii]|uniref:6-O-methylguanine DNA methyltransferase n=1 Tax=Papiliotrema laurentii TaxID=5418 RepID=A0AAD9FVI7_PAPLA|nr:6-O-methylguanine DNA methyltransferase [Papiliotrema laurentii]